VESNGEMRKLQQSLVLFLMFVGPMVLAQTRSTRPAQVEKTSAIQVEAQTIVALANQARAAVGVSSLAWDPALAIAARQHCLRMAAEGSISHRYAGEADLSERAGQAGAHFSLIEENVATGPDPATIHEEWMHSSGHRANLLNREVDRVGVAVVYSRGTLFAVADYGRAVADLTQAQVESAIAGLMRPSGITLLPDAREARVACAMDHGMPASKFHQEPGFVMRWQGVDLTSLPQALANRLASGKYHQAEVGSCSSQADGGAFTTYRVAVLLY
jgi:uncharacterized protein YkwD